MDLDYALGPGWNHLIGDLFSTPYMTRLGKRLSIVAQLRPSLEQMLDAFRLCQPQDVKVIIIGQDPYPHKHANGLAFSTTEPDLPLTLRIVFKALESQGFGLRQNGDLRDWASQGVLLLNTVLTCKEGRSLAHKGWGWEKFVGEVLFRFSDAYKHPYVVLIWGKPAATMIRENLQWQTANVQVYETCHPVAESYSEGRIKFVPHFKQANEWLVKQGQRPVIWNPLQTQQHDQVRRQIVGAAEYSTPDPGI